MWGVTSPPLKSSSLCLRCHVILGKAFILSGPFPPLSWCSSSPIGLLWKSHKKIQEMRVTFTFYVSLHSGFKWFSTTELSSVQTHSDSYLQIYVSKVSVLQANYLPCCERKNSLNLRNNSIHKGRREMLQQSATLRLSATGRERKRHAPVIFCWRRHMQWLIFLLFNLEAMKINKLEM